VNVLQNIAVETEEKRQNTKNNQYKTYRGKRCYFIAPHHFYFSQRFGELPMLRYVNKHNDNPYRTENTVSVLRHLRPYVVKGKQQDEH
jgi:hypothetical protein